MSVEMLYQPEEVTLDAMESSVVAAAVGATVFESLARDSKEAFEQPEDEIYGKIMMSVTRLGDGQTVPDER